MDILVLLLIFIILGLFLHMVLFCLFYFIYFIIFVLFYFIIIFFPWYFQDILGGRFQDGIVFTVKSQNEGYLKSFPAEKQFIVQVTIEMEYIAKD